MAADAAATPKFQRILSFDVGIRHLAYCVLLVPRFGSGTSPRQRLERAQIEAWDMIDLDRVPSVDVCCKRLTDELHKRFAFDSFDVVLIERQPKHRSIVMVAIQMFLCNYFHVARAVNGNACAIKFMHASKKLYCCDVSPVPVKEPTTTTGQNKFRSKGGGFTRKRYSKADAAEAAARYKDNKRRAIEMCTKYLEDVLQDYANAALLEQYSKKDDLSDAFLQAVAFVEGH